MNDLSGKYVVEIEQADQAFLYDGSDAFYQIKGLDYIKFDKEGLSRISKLPLEKALCEAQESGYQKGLRIGRLAANSDNYLQGMKAGIENGKRQVWNWVGKYIPAKEDGGEIPIDDLKRIFGVEFFGEIFKKYTPTEAKMIVDKYLADQKPRFEVGDEVKVDGHYNKAVITGASDYFVCVLYSGGGFYEFDASEAKEKLTKTGRHFDIGSILDAMKED